MKEYYINVCLEVYGMVKIKAEDEKEAASKAVYMESCGRKSEHFPDIEWYEQDDDFRVLDDFELADETHERFSISQIEYSKRANILVTAENI